MTKNGQISRDVGFKNFSNQDSESASGITYLCVFSAISDRVWNFYFFSTEIFAEIFLEKSISSKPAENTQGYVILDADSESWFEKIEQPTSREIWLFFVIFFIVTVFQKSKRKSYLVFRLDIIPVLDSLEPLVSINIIKKILSDAQNSEIMVFQKFFIEDFE